MNLPSTGIIVGRFQVPELHDGHLELFRAVRSRHERVAVFVGLSPTRNASRRHPLDFETRRRMIQAKFPDFSVFPLADKRTDEEWSADLDNKISDLSHWGTVTLYGGRDSFVPHYKGRYSPFELGLTAKCSSTEIRENLTNTVKESFDFRAGIIYANQNRRPRVDAAVDIAILHYGQLPGTPAPLNYVLLAQKPGFYLWRFPGGYSEPGSESFEIDAKREAREETGLAVESLTYIMSSTIKDWRYEKEEDKIKSLFFRGRSMTFGGRADDDICAVRWFPLIHDLEKIFVPEHKDFLKKLLSVEGL